MASGALPDASETKPLKAASSTPIPNSRSYSDFQTDPIASNVSFFHHEEKWQQKIGEGVRFFCLSKYGYTLQIAVNLSMLLLNAYLIIYELLYLKSFSYSSQPSPSWFISCEVFIVIVLLIEIIVRYAEYEFDFRSYFREFGNLGDLLVLFVSIAVLIIYFFENDVTTRAQDNLSLLFVRIFRDIVRLARCIWFMFTLYESVVVFESIEEVSLSRQSRLTLFSSMRGVSYGTFQGEDLVTFADDEMDDDAVVI